MNLDEMKRSMSALDDVLAQKSNEPMTLDMDTCNSALGRISRHYRKGILSCAVLAVVFLALWLSGVDSSSFPAAFKGFLGIFMAVAAILYAFLYHLTTKIRIVTSTPMETMRQVASFRLYALMGEIVLGLVLTVFFTLFLSNLWEIGPYKFWLTAGALLVCVVIGTMQLPKKIKDFRELTAVD